MSALVDAINAALIHSLWQDTVIGVLLWAVLASSRRLATNTRYAIACTALALMALVPMATATALYMRPLPTDVRSPIVSGPVTARGMAASAAGMPRAVRRPVAPSGTAGWIAQWQPWVLPLWAVGVLLFSLRLVSAGVHVRRLERRSEPADDAIFQMAAFVARRLGIERPVRVLVASIADGPATLGWLRPVILLPPAALMGITSAQLEALLAHELAHIRRHDYLVNVVQMVLETVFFYHPAVWWTSRRIRAERELCCDDIAVESCGDALSYAQALTRVARLRVAEPALGSSSGPLVRRIQRVLGGFCCKPARASGMDGGGARRDDCGGGRHRRARTRRHSSTGPTQQGRHPGSDRGRAVRSAGPGGVGRGSLRQHGIRQVDARGRPVRIPRPRRRQLSGQRERARLSAHDVRPGSVHTPGLHQ